MRYRASFASLDFSIGLISTKPLTNELKLTISVDNDDTKASLVLTESERKSIADGDLFTGSEMYIEDINNWR